MEAGLIIGVIVFIIMIGIVYIISDGDYFYLIPLSLAVVFAVSFSFALGYYLGQKNDSINYLNGNFKPTHEKQYIINKDGVKVDSLYIEIK